MSENGGPAKYAKGVVHVYQVPGGAIIINDDHIIAIDLQGPGSQTLVSDLERKGTIDALAVRGANFLMAPGDSAS